MHATLVRATLWGASDKISESDMHEALLSPQPKDQQILGRDISQGIDINDIIKEVSVHYIERALAEAGNSETKAAELLGFNSYQTLNNWMKKNGISV